MTVTGSGNYTGAAELTFRISYQSIALDSTKSVTVNPDAPYAYFRFVAPGTGKYKFYSTGSLDTKGYVYNSSNQQIAYDDDSGENRNFCVTCELKASSVFYFSCRLFNSQDSGTFSVRLEMINEKAISECDFELDNTIYYYDGTAKLPNATITDGSKTLVNGTDYTLSYSNNTDIGTARVTATGKGSYTGSDYRTFTITCETISVGGSKTVNISQGGQLR